MRIVIGRIGASDTVKFAVSELSRYLKRIDKNIVIDERTYDEYDTNKKKVIFVGMGDVPPSDIDRIVMKINDGGGIITGSNERSVLIAVYKTLEALGCRWVRPSIDGEFIPERTLSYADFNIDTDYTPSYRHRGVCIEGANKYENIYDMIDWLPKVGMNEYFMQFHVPYTFFDRWYKYHTADGSEYVTKDDAIHMTRRLDEEIKLRGLTYHKVGHGWTYPLVGDLGAGWYKFEGEVPEKTKALFAEIGGKRELWKGSLFDTNLCYSDPAARRALVDVIVDYCKKNPAVDLIHFWLADASNNQCECEECQKMLPSDYYVMMLNELDEALTREGIDTRIVFLLYLELLWAPEREKIKNPDRFTLMFAPITRSYTETYVESMTDKGAPIDKFVRNNIVLPREVDKNIAFLRRWQQNFDGDSFVFDYHVMWEYALDAGSYRIAKVLHDDMKNLDKLGLDGMMSCQVQRVSAPTCLPTYSMARALWDKNSDFENVSREYFSISFDRDGEKVEGYLKKLSELKDSGAPDRYDLIIGEIERMLPLIRTNYTESEKGTPYNLSWAYLLRHAEIWRMIARGLMLKEQGDDAGAKKEYYKICDYIRQVEDEVQRGLDSFEYIRVLLTQKLHLSEYERDNGST